VLKMDEPACVDGGEDGSVEAWSSMLFSVSPDIFEMVPFLTRKQ